MEGEWLLKVGQPEKQNMNVELQLYGSYGIPSNATTLAYDSIQRHLLVRISVLTTPRHPCVQ